MFLPHLIGSKQDMTAESASLFMAAQSGDEAQVIELLRNPKVSADLFVHPQEQKNSLHVASESGFTRIVEILLKRRSDGSAGAFVDAIAATSQATPLILAAAHSRTDVCEVLLAHGANPNLCNGYGNTALHEAANAENPALVALLLSKGADPKVLNKKGSSALHLCCYSNAHASPSSASAGSGDSSAAQTIAATLLEAGLDVNGRDKNGLTPCLVCSMSGRLDLINFLKGKGADLAAQDHTGRGIYEIASFYNHPEIAALGKPSQKASA